MRQQIEVKASNDMIVKGIAELKDILCKQQCKLKPEEYYPIIIYLNNYANTLKQNTNTQQSNVKMQSTTVFCINSKVIATIAKVKEMLYGQTKIEPEVYLKIFEKMDEYAQILQDQDDGKIVPGPTEKIPEQKESEQTTDTEQTQTATKNEKQDLGDLKSFFD